MMPANVWDEIRSKIQRRVNRLSYAMWFIPTTFVADHDRTVTVRVPNALFRDWITKHNSSLIAEALEEVGRSDATISFIVTAPQRGETGSVKSLLPPQVAQSKNDLTASIKNSPPSDAMSVRLLLN